MCDPQRRHSRAVAGGLYGAGTDHRHGGAHARALSSIQANAGGATCIAETTRTRLAQTRDPRPADVNQVVAEMEELIRRTVGPTVELEVVGAGGVIGGQVADAARVKRPDLKVLFITGYAENAVVWQRLSGARHGNLDQTLCHG